MTDRRFLVLAVPGTGGFSEFAHHERIEMFTVWVTVEVRPEYLREFLRAIGENARTSLRDEPHCHRFDVAELDGAPNRFGFYEIYRDRRAFEVEHLQSPHFLAYQDLAGRMLVPGSQRIATGHLLDGPGGTTAGVERETK